MKTTLFFLMMCFLFTNEGRSDEAPTCFMTFDIYKNQLNLEIINLQQKTLSRTLPEKSFQSNLVYLGSVGALSITGGIVGFNVAESFNGPNAVIENRTMSAIGAVLGAAAGYGVAMALSAGAGVIDEGMKKKISPLSEQKQFIELVIKTLHEQANMDSDSQIAYSQSNNALIELMYFLSNYYPNIANEVSHNDLLDYLTDGFETASFCTGGHPINYRDFINNLKH